MSRQPQQLKVIDFSALDDNLKKRLLPIFDLKYRAAEATKGLISKTDKSHMTKTLDEVHEWMKAHGIAQIVHCAHGYQLVSEETFERVDLSHSFLLGVIQKFYRELQIPLNPEFLADYIVNQKEYQLAKNRSAILRVVKKENVLPEAENVNIGSRIIELARQQMATIQQQRASK